YRLLERISADADVIHTCALTSPYERRARVTPVVCHDEVAITAIAFQQTREQILRLIATLQPLIGVGPIACPTLSTLKQFGSDDLERIILEFLPVRLRTLPPFVPAGVRIPDELTLVPDNATSVER